MTLRYFLAALLLAAAPAASAQKVVQTLSLADQETLGGTVRLANRQTLLLMTSGDAPEVRVVALRPDGQTAWQTKLIKVQQVSSGGKSLFESADDAARRAARSSQLAPVNVYTTGNDVYAVEVISENVARSSKNALKPGQIMVQRINEQGEVQRASFEQPERSKKTERVELGHYGDGNMYYVLAHEYNPRSEVTEYVLERHNLSKGGPVERSVLSVVPAAPERGTFNRYYNEWFYLGHRPGMTYLARRLASHGKQEKPLQKAPLEYEVLVLDNAGQRLGGFTSTLGLPQGQYVAYTGYYMPNLLEQKHRYVPLTSGKVIYDEFKMTTGGYGDFYLDYDSGECIVFGEYTKSERPLVENGHSVEGFFMRSFDPLTGNILRQNQYPYSLELQKQAGFLLAGGLGRICWFSLDPLTGNPELTYSTMGGPFSRQQEFIQLQFDRQFAHLGHQQYKFAPKEWKPGQTVTNVTVARPVCLRKTNGDAEEVRQLFQARPDAPAYGAVRRMHQAAVAEHPDVQYVVSGTGEGQGLLLEQLRLLGGKVTVYAF